MVKQKFTLATTRPHRKRSRPQLCPANFSEEFVVAAVARFYSKALVVFVMVLMAYNLCGLICRGAMSMLGGVGRIDGAQGR